MKMQDDDLLRALQDKEEASAKYVWGELATTREASRREYYKLLKTFPTFSKGWLRRVSEIEKVAVAMSRKPA